ncbi:MAG: L-2-amino-thiazoline-4-carboxylic acid hydrolase [Candidatus Thorarchaeota archaeon]|nr:L-2-amino-thiazoline-4-carboxylic acid hydrolase [Candidatus Thorarchaeota archaeon]
MSEEERNIPIEEAIEATRGALSRVALLHIAFSKVLVEEFGEEEGRDLVAKAINEYGERIAHRLQKGLPDLTPLGLYDETGETDEGRPFARGCTLAKVFEEEDAIDVGYLYCYVDAAKMMAMDPDAKMIYTSCEACGDESCTMDIVPTTEKEQESFASRIGSWRSVDPRLFEFKG